MISAGLDVGSRTIKLVVYDGEIRDAAIVDTGVNPLRRSCEIFNGRVYKRLVVTGYGRYLVAPELGGETVSEIRAHARGARQLYPDCRAIIDIGGQDSKVTLLNSSGEVQKFEMNDRCAAGTGRFLEVMAGVLEVEIDRLGDLALGARRNIQINSLCTVFAESEVVSLVARGEEPGAIALALHRAIAMRIASMARRVGLSGRIVFSGGAARNRCLQRLLEEDLGMELTIPVQPQLVGALGAALMANSA